LNVLLVPALAWAGNWKAAALFVVVERTGKALRGPARDVLLSEATGRIGHGWGFGLHGAMDQTGAVIGPLLMAAAVAKTHRFGPAFLLLAFPAAGTLLALLAARAMNPGKGVYPKAPPPKALPPVFWTYVIAAGVLACGFIDFPLLAYHVQNNALASPSQIPLLYAGAMAVTGLGALVFGRLFDRFGIRVLVAGTVLSAFSLPLAFLGGRAGVIAGIAGWAIGLGAQDACLRSGIAQVVSMNKRGFAFGAFNGVFGVMWFLGSMTMGFLYERSIVALVAFGLAVQLAAAAMFLRLRMALAAAAGN
jgi:MFS family permease